MSEQEDKMKTLLEGCLNELGQGKTAAQVAQSSKFKELIAISKEGEKSVTPKGGRGAGPAPKITSAGERVEF